MKVMKNSSAWGRVGALDDKYSTSMKTSDSLGSKLVKTTAKVATNETVIRVLNEAYSAPAGLLDSIQSDIRDVGEGKPATSDGPKAIELKSTSERVWEAYAGISGASPSRDELEEFHSAVLELMASPYLLDALIAKSVARGRTESDVKKLLYEWCLDSLAWVRDKLKPPAVPPRTPKLLAAISSGGSADQGSGGK